MTLYQSLVIPQITYCDFVYETTNKANQEKLQKVQNMAFRCILKCNKRTPIKRMHDELKILTLDQRRELNRAIQCYKEVNEPSSGLNYMFVPVEIARSTRRSNAKKVKVPRVDQECGRKAFSYRGPVFWNNLDTELKNKESKEAFRQAYIRELLRDQNHPG